MNIIPLIVEIWLMDKIRILLGRWRGLVRPNTSSRNDSLPPDDTDAIQQEAYTLIRASIRRGIDDVDPDYLGR